MAPLLVLEQMLGPAAQAGLVIGMIFADQLGQQAASVFQSVVEIDDLRAALEAIIAHVFQARCAVNQQDDLARAVHAAPDGLLAKRRAELLDGLETGNISGSSAPSRHIGLVVAWKSWWCDLDEVVAFYCYVVLLAVGIAFDFFGRRRVWIIALTAVGFPPTRRWFRCDGHLHLSWRCRLVTIYGTLGRIGPGTDWMVAVAESIRPRLPSA